LAEDKGKNISGDDSKKKGGEKKRKPGLSVINEGEQRGHSVNPMERKKKDQMGVWHNKMGMRMWKKEKKKQEGAENGKQIQKISSCFRRGKQAGGARGKNGKTKSMCLVGLGTKEKMEKERGQKAFLTPGGKPRQNLSNLAGKNWEEVEQEREGVFNEGRGKKIEKGEEAWGKKGGIATKHIFVHARRLFKEREFGTMIPAVHKPGGGARGGPHPMGPKLKKLPM